MKTTPILALLGFSTLCVSAPVQKAQTSAVGGVTAAQLLQISPQATSCTSAQYQDECLTAADAVQYVNAGFARYNVIKPGTKAGLLAWMMYETAGFEYSKNHQHPGQGTRNMQMIEYNTKYATALYPDKVAAAQAQGPDAVLALVNGNSDSFASAAWLLATQCDSMRPQLASGTEAGWNAFLGCISVTPTADRKQVWMNAKAALGVA